MAKNKPERPSVWQYAVAIAVLVCVLYAPAIGYGFTGYDDNDYVTENPNIQHGLGWSTISWAFTTGYASNWHPLTWLSHAVDWQVSGEKAWAHHATNIAFHAANAALLFIFLFRTTGALWPSVLVAVLFAVHPLNVQSVAWVAERKNVLSMFFGLASLIAYTNYAKQPHWRRYLLVCLFLALGLMSKPVLVTWPFVMLLFDYWPLNRIKSPSRPLGPFLKETWRLGIEKIPLVALVLASSIATYMIQEKSGAMGEPIPIFARCENAIVSYLAYIGKTLWPFGLAAFYPHPMGLTPLPLVAGALLLLLAATIGVTLAAPKRRYLAVGWFFYLGTLVPMIGLVQVGSQSMADRYAYVPLIGLFVIVAWGGAELLSKRGVKPKSAHMLAAVLTVLLMLRSWNELPNWKSAIALWQHATRVTTGNYIAHNNLGSAYLDTQPQLALAEFQEALSIRPTHPGALVNLGVLLMDANRIPEAIQAFTKALESNPNHGNAHLNLAIALLRSKRPQEAFAQAKMAQALRPYDPKVYNMLGVISNILGMQEESINYLQYALQLKPDYPNAQSNLQRVLKGPPRP